MFVILIITAVFSFYTIYLYRRARLGFMIAQDFMYSIPDEDFEKRNERIQLQIELDRNISNRIIFFVFYFLSFVVGFRLFPILYNNYLFFPLVFFGFSVIGYVFATNPTDREENRPMSVYARQLSGRYLSMMSLCFFYVVFIALFSLR